MGFISRNLFPACESMCVCCPALRSRSRQPVKRYKKLLAEIFPKSLDGPPNERKIVKLCEYAAKNPFRIPKIAKYLEERCYKELRSDHIKFIRSVTEAYNKLLCMCKEQMAYFAISLLNVVSEMLEKSKQDELLILGCQTLTRFIYSQADGTYAHNIEKFVHKVCKQAHEDGDPTVRSRLRASSLQCLSAMVWFMAEFSYIFTAFEEIVLVILDNYEPDMDIEDDNGRGNSCHNWVNEVVRREGRGGDPTSFNTIIIRPRPERKDPSHLTREEIEMPRVWAQICIQRMAELAKESTTMRLVLDPMFVYFDSGKQWVPQQGLAMIVLSDMSYFLENSDNHQLVLASVVRHLDHKSVAHDPQLKSYIIQVAASLARQIGSSTVLAEMGLVSDLCRHLRKSLQATVESAGEQELNVNISLQNSIENCLFEISKGIGDVRPLLDMMAISLEKLPSSGVVARATIGSLTILAHVISLALVSSHSQQVFPEALLVQLLKVMLHPNLEVRVGVHQIFCVLLIPHSGRPCCMRTGHLSEPKRSNLDAAASASIAALLEKLRGENHGDDISDDCKGRDEVEDDLKQGRTRKNSPNFYNLGSIINRTSGTTHLADVEPCIMKLSEDQIVQLLSAFWIQANLPDNLPPNFEAIAHSFVLTVISSRLKNQKDNVAVRFFQLPLSLMYLSIDPNNGMLPPACKRAIFMLSSGMLMFAAKLYQVPELNNLLKTIISEIDIDPYLGITEDFQIHIKSQSDIGEYGSIKDNQSAASLLVELQHKVHESDKLIVDVISNNLSMSTGLDVDELASQLSEPFAPDESAFMFGQQSILGVNHSQMVSHVKGSLSVDEEITASSLVEDDAVSEASVADLSRFIPKMPASPSISHVISIGQLLESALEVAGHVVGTSVSTSPLPYDTLTRQCDALGAGTRKKLSNWLAHETRDTCTSERFSPQSLAIEHGAAPWKIMSNGGSAEGDVKLTGVCLAMRLPPASPFDNFLKAAGC